MVADGLRLVNEAVRAAASPVAVFLSTTFLSRHPGAESLVASLDEATAVMEVPDSVMREMSETVTPQGVVAVVPIPSLTAREQDRLILIPDGVRDPGNLGTMLRTAWAAGVTEVLIPPGTVDHTAPKVVRAAMGAHFRLPVRRLTWEELWQGVGGARVLLADAGADVVYDQMDWGGDVALVVGGEASGAGEQSRRRADPVRIPMAEGVESLNAAVAAAVLLFEAGRFRAGLQPKDIG